MWFEKKGFKKNFNVRNYVSCMKYFSDCVFLLWSILPVWTQLLQFSGDTSETLPPFEIKFSQISLIVLSTFI